ncbi:UNVERIFIED_CONTAM: hypothetical protein FKN15_070786 [Acipenser sinensis]
MSQFMEVMMGQQSLLMTLANVVPRAPELPTGPIAGQPVVPPPVPHNQPQEVCDVDAVSRDASDAEPLFEEGTEPERAANLRLQDRSAEGGALEEVADHVLVALARPLTTEGSRFWYISSLYFGETQMGPAGGTVPQNSAGTQVGIPSCPLVDTGHSCSLTGEEHKSHDTVSAEKERTGKQKQLGETQTEIQQRIQERLKEIEELKQAVASLKRSACIEIKESEKIFTELIRSIEKIHTEVIELIGANEKAAVNQAEGRMKKLEQEIAELRRRNAELKQLSETEDHIHFLQNFQSLCAPPEAGDLHSVTVNTHISFGAVRKAVSELKDHIEDFCKRELVKITTTDWCEIDSIGRDFSNRPWIEEGQELQDINKDLLQIVGFINNVVL